MSYNGDRKRLLAEASRLEAQLEALPKIGGDAFGDGWRTSHEAHRRAAEAIAQQLREGPLRATISDNPGNAHRMSMMGVHTTCTSGLAGLFRNWITAARRTAGGTRA